MKNDQERQRILPALFAVCFGASLLLALPACEEGPAEDAGEQVDDAVDDAADAVDDAADDVADAIDDAG